LRIEAKVLVNATSRTDPLRSAATTTSGLAIRRKTMFRKLALGLFAAVSLGTAALAPTSASAFWGGGPHWHPGFGFHHFYGGPRFIAGGPAVYGGCIVRRWVPTPWGWRPRLVNRCY
jgi:hypothetical protein